MARRAPGMMGVDGMPQIKIPLEWLNPEQMDILHTLLSEVAESAADLEYERPPALTVGDRELARRMSMGTEELAQAVNMCWNWKMAMDGTDPIVPTWWQTTYDIGATE